MYFKITVLPGDGIGPEVCREAVRILEAVGNFHKVDFRFEEKPIGATAIRTTGSPLPDSTLEACLKSDAVFLGAVGSPDYDHLLPAKRPEGGLLKLRSGLGGFANLRPASSFAPIYDCSPLKDSVLENVNILFIRELLGGLYFGTPRGYSDDRNSASNTMRYSVEEVDRVARVAFEQAQGRRNKVTSVDKANVLETSQLWRKVVTEVSKDYPDVQLDHLLVDACAMHLMTTPSRFDVVVTENLFGDILTDEAAVLTGSLGMLASATIGGQVDLYEPVHGSAPDIAGKGIANPIGAISTAAMLLRHSAHMENEADDLDAAIREVLDAGYRTADLAREGRGKIVGTREMGSLIEKAFVARLDRRFSFTQSESRRGSKGTPR